MPGNKVTEKCEPNFLGPSYSLEVLFGCVEALLAAMYVSRGYRLEITAEGQRVGEKSCDFVVDFNGEKINIEAKSLEDLDGPEDDRIQKMCFDIIEVSIRSQRCSRITIRLDKSLSSHEYDAIVRGIVSFYKSGRNDGQFRVKQICSVEITTIGQWGEGLPMPFLLESYEQGILCHGWQVVAENEQGVDIKNPQITNVIKYNREDISNRILKQIRKASGQFPSMGPSIVHVLIPSFVETSFLTAIDKSYARVYNKLQKDHRRINEVILLGQLYNVKYPHTPVCYNQYVMPNSKPRTRLPRGFNLLFSNKKLKQQFGPEGTAIGSFQPYSPLETQRGRSLYWLCSDDGRSQFRIWVTDQVKLRAELVCPPRGRLLCESSTVKNLDAGPYHVAITWSRKEMVLYLDGERIGVTQL